MIRARCLTSMLAGTKTRGKHAVERRTEPNNRSKHHYDAAANAEPDFIQRHTSVMRVMTSEAQTKWRNALARLMARMGVHVRPSEGRRGIQLASRLSRGKRRRAGKAAVTVLHSKRGTHRTLVMRCEPTSAPAK